MLTLDAAPPGITDLINIPKSTDPLAVEVLLPLTLTPRPAEWDSFRGIWNVKISLCFQGNMPVSSSNFDDV